MKARWEQRAFLLDEESDLCAVSIVSKLIDKLEGVWSRAGRASPPWRVI